MVRYFLVIYMKFFKMQSLGNDFVIVEHNESKLDLPNLAVVLSNRKFGIGCDQVIFFRRTDRQEFSVMFFNNDGSQAGMCGNGVRCLSLLAKILYGQDSATMRIASAIVKTKVINNNRVLTKCCEYPVKRCADEMVRVKDYILGMKKNITHISFTDLGNEHITLFMKNDGYVKDGLLYEVGRKIEEFVVGGINVGFASVGSKNEIFLKVWERGAGFTLGCGSGACAAAIAAVKLGLVKKQDIIVHQSVGDLIANIEDKSIEIIGDAHFVFEGNIKL